MGVQWSDVWSAGTEATRERPDLVPIVATAEALEAMPSGVTSVVLVPDLDLRTNQQGLWNDLEAQPADARKAAAALTRVTGARRLSSRVRSNSKHLSGRSDRIWNGSSPGVDGAE